MSERLDITYRLDCAGLKINLYSPRVLYVKLTSHSYTLHLRSYNVHQSILELINTHLLSINLLQRSFSFLLFFLDLPCSIQDLSSLTRDWTCVPRIGNYLNHKATGKALLFIIKKNFILKVQTLHKSCNSSMNTHTHTLHLDLSIINIILDFWLPPFLSPLSLSHTQLFLWNPLKRSYRYDPSLPNTLASRS